MIMHISYAFSFFLLGLISGAHSQALTIDAVVNIKWTCTTLICTTIAMCSMELSSIADCFWYKGYSFEYHENGKRVRYTGMLRFGTAVNENGLFLYYSFAHEVKILRVNVASRFTNFTFNSWTINVGLILVYIQSKCLISVYNYAYGCLCCICL